MLPRIEGEPGRESMPGPISDANVSPSGSADESDPARELPAVGLNADEVEAGPQRPAVIVASIPHEAVNARLVRAVGERAHAAAVHREHVDTDRARARECAALQLERPSGIPYSPDRASTGS